MREFDAPRDTVFALMTDPQSISEWWGPRGTTTTVDVMDVRPGGSWRFEATDPNGNETAFRGTYREVTPPERLVQTFEWEGMPGLVSVETATFEDLGDGRTRLTTSAIFHTAQERDGIRAHLDAAPRDGDRELLARLRSARHIGDVVALPDWPIRRTNPAARANGAASWRS